MTKSAYIHNHPHHSFKQEVQEADPKQVYELQVKEL